MEHVRCDFIIVGQGLAGTALASHLLDNGHSLAMIHAPALPSSSRIAAGLYNPITGRKMVKTWKADALFPFLIDYYSRLESITGASFLIDRPIYRPFHSFEEQNDWAGKSVNDDFKAYVLKVHNQSQLPWVKDPFGGILLKQCGFLKTRVYLDAMDKYLSDRVHMVRETFLPEKVLETEQGVTYGPIQAKKIIFCEGPAGRTNPWFDWLPFSPVKGEILEVQVEKSSDWIINRGVFMMDLGDGIFRVGSTYDNQDLSWQPTDKGKEALSMKLQQLIDADFTVVRHTAGVRPATRDRHPFLGNHPSRETFVVMNGLGTKGVSLAPYYAKQLAGYLGGKNDLDSEVNINRYFSLY